MSVFYNMSLLNCILKFTEYIITKFIKTCEPVELFLSSWKADYSLLWDSQGRLCDQIGSLKHLKQWEDVCWLFNKSQKNLIDFVYLIETRSFDFHWVSVGRELFLEKCLILIRLSATANLYFNLYEIKKNFPSAD